MRLCLTEISRGYCCITQSHDLPAEGEGEGVCRCSDLVLGLHMSHVFCIRVIDGHHPVAYPDASLSCLPTWGQLGKQNNKGTETTQRLEVHEDRSGTIIQCNAIILQFLCHLTLMRMLV